MYIAYMENKTDKENVTISITKEAKIIGKSEAKKIGLNFSSLVELLIRKLKQN